MNVERELLNHRPLLHAHIIRFREVTPYHVNGVCNWIWFSPVGVVRYMSSVVVPPQSCMLKIAAHAESACFHPPTHFAAKLGR